MSIRSLIVSQFPDWAIDPAHQKFLDYHPEDPNNHNLKMLDEVGKEILGKGVFDDGFQRIKNLIMSGCCPAL